MRAGPRSAIGTRLDRDTPLLTPDGGNSSLGDLAEGQWLVLQLVRYFGCLPCQEWLIALDEAAPDLAVLGVRTAAIGGSADYQARWLRDSRGVQMPLRLDPGHGLRDVLGAGEPLGVRLADPRGVAAYVGALARGVKPQRITSDTVRRPGVVVLDGALTVRWVHVGRRIGDYPPLGDVLGVVRELAPGSKA